MTVDRHFRSVPCVCESDFHFTVDKLFLHSSNLLLRHPIRSTAAALFVNSGQVLWNVDWH